MFPTAPQPIQPRSGTIEEASISAWYIDCQCPGENNLLPTLLVECAAWGAGKARILQLVGLGSMAFPRLRMCQARWWRGGGTLLGESWEREGSPARVQINSPRDISALPRAWGSSLCACVCPSSHRTLMGDPKCDHRFLCRTFLNGCWINNEND